jgi:hypothetical protein
LVQKALSHSALAGLDLWRLFSTMTKISYAGYRFPPEIIQQAIWLYVRFTLSFRDVEDLLAERGITVSYETVRRWVNHFGPKIAADLRNRRPKPHTTWHQLSLYRTRTHRFHLLVDHPINGAVSPCLKRLADQRFFVFRQMPRVCKV